MEILDFFLGLTSSSSEVVRLSNHSVWFVYFLMFLMLFYFNYLSLVFFFSGGKERSEVYDKNEYFFGFFINYSVALGVLGTLVSVGVGVSFSGQSFSEVIGVYFGVALSTTVVGIVLYGYFYLVSSVMYYLKSK